MQAELAPLGVDVTIVEPGSFRTEFLTSGSRSLVPVTIDDYADTVGTLLTAIEANDGHQPGDPARAVAAILRIAGTPDPPVRLPLGSDAVALVEGKLRTVGESLDRWRSLSLSTDFPD